MKEATVEDGNKQDMKQFWCYFCVQECERDRRLNSALLKDAAMIEHLSRSDKCINILVHMTGIGKVCTKFCSY